MSIQTHRGLLGVTALAATILLLVAGCTGQPESPPKSSAKQVTATPDVAYLANLGWTPTDNSLGNLACTDNSYQKALENGVNLGIYTAAPYEYLDAVTNKPAGIDWDINMAVLKYLGITKYETVTLQWAAMIPALNSSRIDVITGNIHETADRLKNIAFTSPAWWYGSTLVTPKNNPKVHSWKDLNRADVTVGVITGSASQTNLEAAKVKITPYDDANAMYAALAGGRNDAIVDDSPKSAAYILANPSAGLVILHTADLPPKQLIANYARYGLRKADCTLTGAYSRAVSELRAHGVISTILKTYGLTENLYEPQYKP